MSLHQPQIASIQFKCTFKLHHPFAFPLSKTREEPYVFGINARTIRGFVKYVIAIYLQLSHFSQSVSHLLCHFNTIFLFHCLIYESLSFHCLIVCYRNILLIFHRHFLCQNISYKLSAIHLQIAI